MSDRLLSVAPTTTTRTFNELQQQQQHQSSYYPPMMASGMLASKQQAAAATALHFQRLQDYGNANRTMPNAYEPRGYYGSGGGGGGGGGGIYGTPQPYGHYGHNSVSGGGGGGGGGGYLSHYYNASAAAAAAASASASAASTGHQYEASYAARQRYAAAAAYQQQQQQQQQMQHHHQPHQHPNPQPPSHHLHPSMFTPAGQQLVPSSVLHYPPRHSSYHGSGPGVGGYDQPTMLRGGGATTPPPMPYSNRSSYASTGAYNGSAYGSQQQQQPHHHHFQPTASTHRSTTPAPNRTVVPHYLEPLRNYHDSLTRRPISVDAGVGIGSVVTPTTPTFGFAAGQTLPNLKSPHADSESPSNEAASTAAAAGRLTTSPPLISATGTDSGISNCSTRARSDSSQSTPVYSGEYPVSMSVESASCVSYHCGAAADSKDFEERAERGDEANSERSASPAIDMKSAKHDVDEKLAAATTTTTTDDISQPSDNKAQHAATSTSKSSKEAANMPTTETKSGPAREGSASDVAGTGPEADEVDNEDDNNADDDDKAVVEAEEDDDMKREFNLPARSTTLKDADALLPSADNSRSRNRCNDAPLKQAVRPTESRQSEESTGGEGGGGGCVASVQNASSNNNNSWSPFASYSPTSAAAANAVDEDSIKRQRTRTPPVPHNSPVGYGSSSAPPPLTITPRAKTATGVKAATPTASKSGAGLKLANKNRIIECDLIPSKKSKRNGSTVAAGSSNSSGVSDDLDSNHIESLVREEIRDIKPLPGFQQAFGSTEIGRFSETFLLTPETAIDVPLPFDEYAPHGAQHGLSYYEPSYDNGSNYWSAYDYDYRRQAHHFQQYHHHQQQQLQFQQQQHHYGRFGPATRSHFYPPDYMPYERYGARSAAHARFGEIRCNGY